MTKTEPALAGKGGGMLGTQKLLGRCELCNLKNVNVKGPVGSPSGPRTIIVDLVI